MGLTPAVNDGNVTIPPPPDRWKSGRDTKGSMLVQCMTLWNGIGYLTWVVTLAPRHEARLCWLHPGGNDQGRKAYCGSGQAHEDDLQHDLSVRRLREEEHS